MVVLVYSATIGFSVFKILQKSKATNYIHSKTCRSAHYLELDCFDTCAGEQFHAHSKQKQQVPDENNVIISFEGVITAASKLTCFSTFNFTILFINDISWSFFMVRQIIKPPINSGLI